MVGAASKAGKGGRGETMDEVSYVHYVILRSYLSIKKDEVTLLE